MNVREVSRALVSGTVVYLVMASCSPSTGGPNVANSSDAGVGHGGANGAGAAMATGGGGPSILDAAVNRITNPVPDAKADVYQSGTRLRAKYLLGEDGSRLFQWGFHDMQRNEDCFFGLAADGVQRCLPSPVASGSGFFSDVGCSVPLAAVAKNACSSIVPKYALLLVPPCTALEIHLMGVAIPSGTIYQGTPAKCTPWDIATNAATYPYDIYSMGTEVSPSEFVKATETIE
jgi:hypothetical protein